MPIVGDAPVKNRANARTSPLERVVQWGAKVRHIRLDSSVTESIQRTEPPTQLLNDWLVFEDCANTWYGCFEV